jgi:Fe2+ or Zn2+ uptake regulation protein
MSHSRMRFINYCFKHFTDDFYSGEDIVEHMKKNKIRYTPQARSVASIIKRNCHPDSYEVSSKLTSVKNQYNTVRTFKFKKQIPKKDFKHNYKRRKK